MTVQHSVADVMSHPVISVGPGAAFRRVAELMREKDISATPVVDEDRRPLGIVSEDDLLARERTQATRRGDAWAERWWADADQVRATASTAGGLMTAPAITITADASLALAARRMHDAQVKRLVVVDTEGRMVGVVSRRDLLSVYAAPDAEIRMRVLAALVPRLAWCEASTVTVSVDGGVVHLDGEVPYRSDAMVLEALARTVDGIVEIDNRLEWASEDVAALSILEAPGVPAA